jgi:hypothetical protein
VERLPQCHRLAVTDGPDHRGRSRSSSLWARQIADTNISAGICVDGACDSTQIIQFWACWTRGGLGGHF